MRACLGLMVLSLVFAGSSPAQSSLTPAQKQLNIDSFEQVWTTVRDKHWDPTLGGIDWQAVHDELRPKVENAASMHEARAAMAEMLLRLKQTHFGIVAGDAYKELDKTAGGSDDSGPSDGGPGLDARIIDGHAFVTSVDSNSSAAAKGVKTGWEIVRIGDKDIVPALKKIRDGMKEQLTLLDLIQTRSVTGRLQGAIGKPVEVEFLDGKNKKVSLSLDRAKPRGKLFTLGNMPPMHFWVESSKVHGDIGYVKFNMFMDPDALEDAFRGIMKTCGDCKGFVVDVRGNPGGLGGLATGVASWFISQKEQKLGTMIMRTGKINFPIFPRPEPFQRPMAVLIDGNSASTSEIFAGGMQDLKRARVFGTRSAGAALPSVFTKLPNGDGFQYAIANYISLGGEPLEGIGVKPDQEVKLTRHQLLEGQDPALDAAVSWIRKQN